MAPMNGQAPHAPPNQFAPDLANAPVITLAGMEFPIPPLAIIQLRIVVPTLAKLDSFLKAIQAGLKGTKELDASVLDTATFDKICDIVYTACTRAKPGFARAEFDNMPISLGELLDAIPVIGRQTKMMKPQGGGAAPDLGENTGASDTAMPSPTSI